MSDIPDFIHTIRRYPIHLIPEPYRPKDRTALGMPRLFPLFLIAAVALSFFSAQKSGENIFRFPYHADFEIPYTDPTPEEGIARERIAKRIFLTVIDGLNEKSTATMPFFSSLKKKGAYFRAQAPFPSLSRPGYTTILTGAEPEITGVSSNVVESMDRRIDSFSRRAHAARWKTALVGLSWWLDFFDADFDIARVDSGYHENAALFTAQAKIEPGISAGREVLWHGRYQPTPDGWRNFIQKYRIVETFGDDPATQEAEDALRTREALFLWQKKDVDFMLLHLQMPDQAGHDHAGLESAAYHRALVETDTNLRRVADAVNPRDTVLIVTADHGFTTSVQDAGHGGHEESAREIPLLMTGVAIKPGMHGKAEQRDIAPTMALLAGLSSPSHNTGKILEAALDIPLEQLNPGKSRLRKQKNRFEGELPASQTLFLDRFITDEKLRNVGGLALLIFALVLLAKTTQVAGGFLFWLLYVGGGAGIYGLIFRVFSISSFYEAWKNIAWMVVIHTAWGALLFLIAKRLSLRHLLYQLVLFSGLVSAVFAFTIPWYSWSQMPAGLHVFSAIFIQVDCLAASILCVIVWVIPKYPHQLPMRI